MERLIEVLEKKTCVMKERGGKFCPRYGREDLSGGHLTGKALLELQSTMTRMPRSTNRMHALWLTLRNPKVHRIKRGVEVAWGSIFNGGEKGEDEEKGDQSTTGRQKAVDRKRRKGSKVYEKGTSRVEELLFANVYKGGERENSAD